MNSKWLIDAVVHQSTVLIAALATSAGIRAPLSHIANAVFLDIVHELEGQGVSRKVIADMFGLALRSYQLKVQRLEESATVPDRSLWEAVLGYIRDQEVVIRADVLTKFRLDDQDTVKGVLHDLVENGFVFKMGRGHRMTYRAASEDELSSHLQVDPEGAAAALTWMAVYHRGPIRRAALLQETGVAEDLLDEALAELIDAGRIVAGDASPDPPYRCDVCVIPMGEPEGWAAAVFDHYNVMVAALCAKLRRGDTTAYPDDTVGGSTYSFDLWDDHPHEERVRGLLADFRRTMTELRNEVTDYNEKHGRSDQETYKVKFYCGQNTIRPEEREEDE